MMIGCIQQVFKIDNDPTVSAVAEKYSSVF